MNIEKYAQHYFNFKNAGVFMLVSFIGLFLVMLIIILLTRMIGGKNGINGKAAIQFVESFYELVFSGTSILFFIAAYYLIDRFLVDYRSIWNKYNDFILMGFIILSVVLNALLDKAGHLKELAVRQVTYIRLVSTIYIMLIFAYIKFIYQDDNYDKLIVYFLGLVIGRFIFFDFTWKEFATMLRGILRDLPLLLLILIYTGLMCWYGFRSHFLLKSNGVVVSIFIAHLFMDVAIILLQHTRYFRIFGYEPEKESGYEPENGPENEPEEEHTDHC